MEGDRHFEQKKIEKSPYLGNGLTYRHEG